MKPFPWKLSVSFALGIFLALLCFSMPTISAICDTDDSNCFSDPQAGCNILCGHDEDYSWSWDSTCGPGGCCHSGICWVEDRNPQDPPTSCPYICNNWSVALCDNSGPDCQF